MLQVLNPLNQAPGDRDHITVAELQSIHQEEDDDWKRQPDQQFYLAYDFAIVDDWTYRDAEHYPVFGGN